MDTSVDNFCFFMVEKEDFKLKYESLSLEGRMIVKLSKQAFNATSVKTGKSLIASNNYPKYELKQCIIDRFELMNTWI